MKPSTGATPLFALEAVAIDTETTGLEPASARIVQIGAVGISAGRILPANSFEKLVNPGIPVPAQSTKIHGIGDATAKAAPPLPGIWHEFRSFISRRVLIGHSVGFDLAVLGKEASRHRLDFDWRHALDVRMLAAIAAPALADRSLDALAAWLGIGIKNRHRALDDAVAAAGVFLGLVPHLERKGIRTLAEAERACLGLSGERVRQENAGWTSPLAGPATADKTSGGGPLQRIDSYAYRHKVGDVMSSPVIVVRPGTTLKAAMDRMVRQAVSSVFVASSGRHGEKTGAYGILTERDLMRHVAASGAAAFAQKAGDAASRPVRTIRANAFLYRAIGRMSRMKIRHLGVTSDDDRLIGVVSARDLLRLRSGLAVALDDAIEEARNARDLAVAWSGLPAVVNSLIGEGVEGGLVCQIVSEEIRAMTRRAAVLGEESMAADGLGEAPCPYAVMVLGSGGRGESLLVPDQDNAIVFATGEPGGPQDKWFGELGARLAAILDEAGIPFCKGGVMAKNPQWRGDVTLWRRRVAEWVQKSRPQDLLNVDIFYDAMPVSGDLALGNDLFSHAYAQGHKAVSFAKLLGESVGSPPSPFSFLGNLKADGNRLDLKLHALFPIASMARALAIRHNLAERSTRARLEGLIALGIGAEADLSKLARVHATVLSILLESQSASIDAGKKASNDVDLGALSRDRKSKLAQAIRDVGVIPELTRALMFAVPPGKKPERAE